MVTAMRKRTALIGPLLILQLAALFLSFSAPQAAINPYEISPTDVAITKGMLLGIPIVVSGLLLLLGNFTPRLFGLLIKFNLPFLLTGLLAVVSMAWSPMPDETMRRGLALLAAVISVGFLAGVYVRQYGEQASTKAVWHIMLVGLGFLIFVFVMYAIYPDAVTTFRGVDFGGRLGGYLIPTNTLGALASTLAALSIVEGVFLGRHRSFCIVLFILSSVAAYMTESRGGMLSGLGALAVTYVLFLRMRAINYAAVAKIALLSFVVLAVVGGTLIWSAHLVVETTLRGGSVGELMTFNNRLHIWRAVIPTTPVTLLFGHGYAMISDTGLVRLGIRITQHAHSGYLQVLSGLGVTGLLLMFWFFAKLARLWAHVWRVRHGAVLPVTALIVAFILNNVVEASMGYQIVPPFILMLIVVNTLYLERMWYVPRARNRATFVGSATAPSAHGPAAPASRAET